MARPNLEQRPGRLEKNAINILAKEKARLREERANPSVRKGTDEDFWPIVDEQRGEHSGEMGATLHERTKVPVEQDEPSFTEKEGPVVAPEWLAAGKAPTPEKVVRELRFDETKPEIVDEVGSSIDDDLEVIDEMPSQPMSSEEFASYLDKRADYAAGEVVTRPGKRTKENWTVEKAVNGKVYLKRGRQQAIMNSGDLALEQMSLKEIDGIDHNWDDTFRQLSSMLPADFAVHRNEIVQDAAEQMVRARATGKDADPAHELYLAMQRMQRDLKPRTAAVKRVVPVKRPKAELPQEAPMPDDEELEVIDETADAIPELADEDMELLSEEQKEAPENVEKLYNDYPQVFPRERDKVIDAEDEAAWMEGGDRDASAEGMVIARYTEPYRRLTDQFGGAKEFLKLYNEAKEKTNHITFSLEDLGNANFFKRWLYRRQLQKAAKELLSQEEAGA